MSVTGGIEAFEYIPPRSVMARFHTAYAHEALPEAGFLLTLPYLDSCVVQRVENMHRRMP